MGAMITCDNCGKRTRTVIPTYRHPPPPVDETLDESRPIARSVLRTINPALEAAIPWGEHPDDAKGPEFGQVCPDCAPLVYGSNPGPS